MKSMSNTAVNQRLISLGSEGCGQTAAAWDQICTSLADHGHVYLFTDFDGTLADITPVPNAAVLDHRTGIVLRRLSSERKVTLVVLSGRSVSDVADRVGLPLIYGGDHGLEIHGSDFEFVVPGADAARLRLPGICNQIREVTRDIPGTLVEAKRFSASVHYRQVAPDRIATLYEAVTRSLDPARFEIREGHCVFEIRPRVNWDKGDALQWVLERNRATSQQAICLGDDETDEDMFRRVPNGINVRVTERKGIRTAAQYCLTRQEVPCFLEGILDVVHGVS